MTPATALLLGTPTPWSEVKGFNYQPSYGRTGYELWANFDERQIAIELDRGREHFPQMNALRWWLSWDAFMLDGDVFERNFETALRLAAERGMAVMPVLFNRWHDRLFDWGGTYVDHFLPGVSSIQRALGEELTPDAWEPPREGQPIFDAFLERIVGAHAGDERIFAWDVCNEPFCYQAPLDQMPSLIVDAEVAWLTRMSEACRRLDPHTPVCVGIHSLHGVDGLRRIEPISDVLTMHPYFSYPYFDEGEELLDEYAEVAAASGKPLLVTETCWGSSDDAERVEIIHSTLSTLKRRGIGWLAYCLHHSLTVDAHRPEHGPVNDYVGPTHFIEADGSLRPGHDAFNDY